MTGRDESRILFVDARNTGLSAAAELISERRFGDRGLTFKSAGVNADIGQNIADDVRAALERRGIHAASRLARRVDREDAERAGLVLVLDGSNRQQLLEAWPNLATRAALLTEAAAVAGWATAGPVTTSRSSHGVARLDGTGRHAGTQTAQWLVRQCTHAAAFDVIDRSGDGAVASEDAVGRIEEALKALLPWYARAISA